MNHLHNICNVIQLCKHANSKLLKSIGALMCSALALALCGCASNPDGLLLASKAGDLPEANRLRVEEADVKAKDRRDESPLHLATGIGHKDIAELLNAKGTDVSVKDDESATSLEVAANWGNRDVADILITTGEDISPKTKYGVAPLNIAFNKDRIDVAELLIEKGADINSKNKEDDIPVQKPSSSPPAKTDKKFYAYFDFGLINYTNAPKGSTGGLLLGGGYHYNKYVGVETGLSIIKDSTSNNDNNFSFSSSPNDSLSADSFQVAVVGTLPLNDQYDLIGKLGLAHTSLSYSYSYTPCGVLGCYGPTVTGGGSASKTNPMFGVGWQWKPNPDNRLFDSDQQLRIRVQYENFGKIKMTATYSDLSSATYDIEVEVITIGIIYNF